jgi:hypothetical protein
MPPKSINHEILVAGYSDTDRRLTKAITADENCRLKIDFKLIDPRKSARLD